MIIRLTIEELKQALNNLITAVNEVSFSFKELYNQSVPDADPTVAISNEDYLLENLSKNPFLKELK